MKSYDPKELEYWKKRGLRTTIHKSKFTHYCRVCKSDTEHLKLRKVKFSGDEIKYFCLVCRKEKKISGLKI